MLAYHVGMKLQFRALFLIFSASCIGFAAAEQPLPIPRISRESPLWGAVEAYRNRWDFTAIELAAPFADKGDPDALFLMGLTRETQQPARQSRGQAIEYFYRKAAAAGHPEAAVRCLLIPLGSNLESEKNDAKAALETAAAKKDLSAARLLGEAWLRGFVDGNANFDKAAECWEMAAKSGDASSMVLMGKLLDGTFGFSEKRDPAKAAEYYREAKRVGDDQSLIPLGRLLLGGDESIRSEEEGRNLLNAAAEKGDARAYLFLGDYEMSSENNQQAAAEFYGKGARAGEPKCMLKLATGLLTKSDSDTEGLRWLEKSADSGNPDAAANIGRRLAGQNPSKAARYLLLAANEGIPEAQSDIANLYLSGGLGYRDPASAVAWLTEAMKSGNAQMQYKLGTLHEQGIGGPINYANAGVLYTMASTKGVAAASGRIAYMASEGLGMKSTNLPQAWAYASLAVERGDIASKDLLALLEKKMDETAKVEGAKVLGTLKSSPAKQVIDNGTGSSR